MTNLIHDFHNNFEQISNFLKVLVMQTEAAANVLYSKQKTSTYFKKQVEINIHIVLMYGGNGWLENNNSKTSTGVCTKNYNDWTHDHYINFIFMSSPNEKIVFSLSIYHVVGMKALIVTWLVYIQNWRIF